MFKIKSAWYNSQSFNSDYICQERAIWNLILENKMDDVKAYFATHKGDTLNVKPSEGDEGEAANASNNDNRTDKRTIPLLRKKIDKFSKDLFDNLEQRAKRILAEVEQVLAGEVEGKRAKEKEKLISGKEAYEKPLYQKVFALETFGEGHPKGTPEDRLEEVLSTLVEYVIASTDKKHKFESVARYISKTPTPPSS